jgi:hypothetical protein
MQMNTAELVQWQKYAPNGLVYPWFTHPFLDVLEAWDLSKHTILETGAGRSTAWWRSQAKWVDSIEATDEWQYQITKDCSDAGLNNGRLFCTVTPDGVQERKQEYFDLIPNDLHYDIVVVDGIWRYEMLQWALDHFKKTGGMIIADNWIQSYVWLSPPAEELMKPYKANVFEQTDHTDNDGINKWKTAYWII